MFTTMKKIFISIIATLLAHALLVQAAELTGTVNVNGTPVPATYRQLSSSTVALGNGRNACV